MPPNVSMWTAFSDLPRKRACRRMKLSSFIAIFSAFPCGDDSRFEHLSVLSSASLAFFWQIPLYVRVHTTYFSYIKK